MTNKPDEQIPIDIFAEPMVWESPLQRVMEDLVREGDTVLDVGANIGALTAFLWKLVGSQGRVHSFEANPQLVVRIIRNLAYHRVPTEYLQNAAVWSESGCNLTLAIDPSYYQSSSRVVSTSADSENADEQFVQVKSLALDDYCDKSAIVPSFIKIDVEGAEEHVLRGASRLLDLHRPSLIFEYVFSNPAPALFLLERGYSLFDVHSYESLDPARAERRDLLTNILAVHRSNPLVQNVAWKHSPIIRNAAFLPARKLEEGDEPDCISTDYFELRPGRWLISAEFDLEGSGNASLRVADENQRAHYLCEAPYPYISSYVCSNAVIKVSSPGRFICRLESKSPDLTILGGRVRLQEITFGIQS